MYNLTKKEKLDFIKQEIEKQHISAYTISKNTNLTEAGVGKILNGTVKNPHESSIDTILLYLEKRQLDGTLSTENTVEESQTVYEKQDLNKKYISCIETEIKLLKEIARLQALLRKNKIEFDEEFED